MCPAKEISTVALIRKNCRNREKVHDFLLAIDFPFKLFALITPSNSYASLDEKWSTRNISNHWLISFILQNKQECKRKKKQDRINRNCFKSKLIILLNDWLCSLCITLSVDNARGSNDSNFVIKTNHSLPIKFTINI